jgi:hypothetical protein
MGYGLGIKTSTILPNVTVAKIGWDVSISFPNFFGNLLGGNNLPALPPSS